MPLPRARWLLVCALAMVARAHEPVAREMAQAAAAFLDSLPAAQRARVVYPFDDDERENWAFVPRSRAGLPLKEMPPPQREQALALVRSALSVRGAQQAEAIISLEPILRRLEGAAYRDPGLYYVTVFGHPGRPPWAWRFEGHHLSLNVTLPDPDHVTVTPTFFGANPAEVPDGPQRGQRTLAAEEDLARALLASLDGEQRSLALISDRAPRDLITGNDRVARPLEPLGLPADRLRPEQRQQLDELLRVYVTRYRDEISIALSERLLQGGLVGLHFAWAGGAERGEGHYYRIQGATFLIEYDNTQDGANHVHTAFRDFTRDFGRDLLREHYAEDHAADPATAR